jgi:hypothetical protein
MAELLVNERGLHSFVPNGSFHVLGIISKLKGNIWWNFNWILSVLYYWIVQMSFCIERSIHWRPNVLIPTPIFYFLIFLHDTLDWAPRKKETKSGCFKKQMFT